MCHLWAHSTVSLLNLLVSIQEGVCLLYRTAFAAGTITKSPLTKVFSQLILNCKSFLCIKSYTTCVLCTKVSCNSYFYNNCPISRTLIGWFLSLIRGQVDKIWKLGLARAALCKWATCTRQTCLSKTLFIPGIWPVSGLAEPLACGLWFHSHFDNVMMQFIFNKRTDA